VHYDCVNHDDSDPSILWLLRGVRELWTEREMQRKS
jgi:hypothetical protein